MINEKLVMMVVNKLTKDISFDSNDSKVSISLSSMIIQLIYMLSILCA